MLLFDWKKVYDTAQGDIYTCNLIMSMLIKGTIPKNKFDPLYKFSHKNFAGSSFLVHPDVLMYHSYKYTQREIAIYYALASMRSYGEYLATQKITLDSLHCPTSLNLITDNRLLVVDDRDIYFRYEEVTETIH